jgi:acetylglutamate kinase
MERLSVSPVPVKEETVMETLIEKAETLIKALPYIRKFYGKTFVVKYGGAAQIEESLKDSFAQDVVLLNYIGINTIVVHGGGPKVTETMKKMGKSSVFVQGLRVTDEETIDIVEMVLGGLINKEIVALINSHGGKAVGLTGKDGGLIQAEKKLLRQRSAETGDDEVHDIGLVGSVKDVNPGILVGLDRNGFIPVVAPIGVDDKGQTLNINADFLASSLASAIKAEKLILMTDVPGILDHNGNLISTLGGVDAERLINEETISGGMIPKVRACLEALESGVKKTHIVDGRIPHCLLLEIFTEKGIGTEIVKDRP